MSERVNAGGACFWCGEPVYDGRKESGADSTDWCTQDGDFGCDSHPITGEDGTGPHETEDDIRRIVTDYHLSAS